MFVKEVKGKKYILLLLFGLLVFLSIIPFLRSPSNMGHCIFCEIAGGRVPQTKIEVETSEFVIFKDIKPSSTYHYLAVSKRHIDSVKTLTKADLDLVNRMEAALKQFFTTHNIDTKDALFGFHLPPFISVKHLHMHAIAPRSTMSFISRMMFKPGSMWFKTSDETREMLQKKA